MSFTVQELRDLGISVRVTHYRAYYNYDHWPQISTDLLATHDGADVRYALPRGGKTVVEVTTPSGETFQGVSVCSKHDAYAKKDGVRYALGRAMTALLKSKIEAEEGVVDDILNDMGVVHWNIV